MSDEEDFDLDDDNFDDFDNMDDLDFDGESEDVKDDRKPIVKAATSFKDSVKNRATDPKTIEEFAKNSLPASYGNALTEAQSLGNTAYDIYKDTKKKAEPGLRNLRKVADKNMETLEKVLPKSWAEKLKSTIATEKESGQLSKAASQDDLIGSSIDAIFAKKQATEANQKQVESEISETREEIKEVRAEGDSSFLRAMSASLSRIVGYQDGVLTAYQKKSLELQYRQYFTARDQLEYIQSATTKQSEFLETIVKNTGLPEITKLHLSESAEGTIRDKVLGHVTSRIGGFGGRFMPELQRNISGALSGVVEGFNDGTEQLLDMADEDGPSLDGQMMMGEVGGNIFVDFALNKAAEILKPHLSGNEKIAYIDKQLEYYGGNWQRMLADWAGDDEDGNWITDFVKELLPRGGHRSYNDAMSMLDNDNFIDNRKEMVDRSIIEIIPEHLSNIGRWVQAIATGDDPGLQGSLAFNPIDGTMTTKQQAADAISKRIFRPEYTSSIYAGGEAAIDALDKDKKLSEEARSALREQLLRNAHGNESFSLKNYANEGYYSENIREDLRKEISNFFSEEYGGDEKSLGNDKLESRNAASRYVNTIRESTADYDEDINKLSYYGNRDMLKKLGLLSTTAEGNLAINENLVISQHLKRVDDLAKDEERAKLVSSSYTEAMEKREAEAEEAKSRGIFARMLDGVRKKREDEEATRQYVGADAQNIFEQLTGGSTEQPIAPQEVQGQALSSSESQDLSKAFEENAAQAAGADSMSNIPHARIDSTGIHFETDHLATHSMQESIQKAIEDCCKRQDQNMTESNSFLELIQKTLVAGLKIEGDGGVIGNATPSDENKGLIAELKDVVVSAWRGLWGEKPEGEDEERSGLLPWLFRKYSGATSLVGSAFDTAKKMLGNTADGLFGKLVKDIYMDGREGPIMKAELLRKDFYINLETETPIRYPEDVTGPVLTVDGDIVIDEADAERRLYVIGDDGSFIERNIVRAKGLAKGAYNLVKDFYGTVFGAAGALLGPALMEIGDIHIAGDDPENPRFTKAKLIAGKYRDKVTGEIIKRISDIKGVVVDEEGMTILDVEDLKKDMYSKYEGVVNVWGRVKSGLAMAGTILKDKGKYIFEQGISLGKSYFEMLGNIYGSFLDAIGSIGNPFDFTDNQEYNRDVLLEIRDILNRGLLNDEFETKAEAFDENAPGFFKRTANKLSERWKSDEDGGIIKKLFRPKGGDELSEAPVQPEPDEGISAGESREAYVGAAPSFAPPPPEKTFSETVKERAESVRGAVEGKINDARDALTSAPEQPEQGELFGPKPKEGLLDAAAGKAQDLKDQVMGHVSQGMGQLQNDGQLDMFEERSMGIMEHAGDLIDKVSGMFGSNLNPMGMPYTTTVPENFNVALQPTQTNASLLSNGPAVSPAFTESDAHTRPSQGFDLYPDQPNVFENGTNSFDIGKTLEDLGGFEDHVKNLAGESNAKETMMGLRSIVMDYGKGLLSRSELLERATALIEAVDPNDKGRFREKLESSIAYFDDVRNDSESFIGKAMQFVDEARGALTGLGGLGMLGVGGTDSDHDTDDDGDRDGSWQDQLRQREEEERQSKMDMILAALSGGHLGGGGGSRDEGNDQPEESGGLLGGLKDKWDSVTDFFGGGDDDDGPGGRRRGLGSKLWGFAKKAGGFLATRTLPAVATVGGGLLSAAGAIVTSPITLGVAAVAGAGFLGYLAYKALTDVDVNKYDKIRYSMYGIDPEDQDQLKKAALLEEEVGKAVSVSGESATIKDKQIDLKNLAEAVGIKVGSHDSSQGHMPDTTAMSLPSPSEGSFEEFVAWFNERFRVAYLKHRLALARLKVTDTNDFTPTQGSDYTELMSVGADDPIWRSTARAFGQDPLVGGYAVAKAVQEEVKSEAAEDTGKGSKSSSSPTPESVNAQAGTQIPNTAAAAGVAKAGSFVKTSAAAPTPTASPLSRSPESEGFIKSEGMRFKAPIAGLANQEELRNELNATVRGAKRFSTPTTPNIAGDVLANAQTAASEDRTLESEVRRYRQVKNEEREKEIIQAKPTTTISPGQQRVLEEQLKVQRLTLEQIRLLNGGMGELIRMVEEGGSGVFAVEKEQYQTASVAPKASGKPKRPSIDMS